MPDETLLKFVYHMVKKCSEIADDCLFLVRWAKDMSFENRD